MEERRGEKGDREKPNSVCVGLVCLSPQKNTCIFFFLEFDMQQLRESRDSTTSSAM